jgi:hypothetical protein
MTNDRPDPSSEGAPDFKNTPTVKEYLTSGHEPQMGLDTKTDWPTDRRSQRDSDSGSAVGTATGYGLEDRAGGVRVLGRAKNILFSMSSRPVLGPTQPLIQWVLGALSPGVKRPGRAVA